jgi:hypothetical protein
VVIRLGGKERLSDARLFVCSLLTIAKIPGTIILIWIIAFIRPNSSRLHLRSLLRSFSVGRSRHRRGVSVNKYCVLIIHVLRGHHEASTTQRQAHQEARKDDCLCEMIETEKRKKRANSCTKKK